MDRFFEFLLYMPGIFPYFAAFGILVICGLGVPIPEDIILFTMGYLSYNGLVDFKVSVVVCLFGVMIGDSIIYFIGRKYGSRLLQSGFFARMMPPDRMDRTRQLFLQWGNKMIFAARFMPGLRAPTFFSAGALHLPFKVFFFYDGLAALLSVPLFTALTYYFGEQIDHVIEVARQAQYGIVGLIVGLVALLVVKSYIMKRRRLARASMEKKSSSELSRPNTGTD